MRFVLDNNFSCKKSVVSLVIPSNYSFNLNGSCIYFAVAILFIAQAFGIDLSIKEILEIILVLLLTSKDASGIGLITLAAKPSICNAKY